ncbi:MAG: sigma-70 family RNA polymerase sigma factor [Planctomycetota bacterium]
MTQAAGSQRAAFDALVAEHQETVLRICRSILRDDHLGADAAQETFLRLWRRLRERRAPGSHGAWLRRVAATTAIDAARSRRTRSDAHATELAEGARGERHVEPRLPEEDAALAELEQRLASAVARLPEGQRTVFALRHSAGLPLAEVAETLGVALPTVKTQFARACLRLQDALSTYRSDSA